MEKNLEELTIQFTIDVTKMCDAIPERRIFGNQLIRSASSIGANVFEANYAQSNLDFVHKMEIALKECYETEYWLKVLLGVGSLQQEQYQTTVAACGKIRRKIIASIKTIKSKIAIE